MAIPEQISWLGVVLLTSLPSPIFRGATRPRLANRRSLPRMSRPVAFRGVRHPYSRGTAGASHSTSLHPENDIDGSPASAASSGTQDVAIESVIPIIELKLDEMPRKDNPSHPE